jgi:hypothetical protein
MIRAFFTLTLAVVCVLFASCAEIEPPSTSELLSSPLGKGALHVGMTKDEVRDIWGEPDTIEPQGADEWGTALELWVYNAKFPGVVPFDVGYASKSKYLSFSGNNLVSFHD